MLNFIVKCVKYFEYEFTGQAPLPDSASLHLIMPYIFYSFYAEQTKENTPEQQ
jgi:hypothetical protein